MNNDTVITLGTMLNVALLVLPGSLYCAASATNSGRPGLRLFE